MANLLKLYGRRITGMYTFSELRYYSPHIYYNKIPVYNIIFYVRASARYLYNIAILKFTRGGEIRAIASCSAGYVSNPQLAE